MDAGHSLLRALVNRGDDPLHIWQEGELDTQPMTQMRWFNLSFQMPVLWTWQIGRHYIPVWVRGEGEKFCFGLFHVS